MSPSIRVVLAGGGTGGHLIPGIALSDTLRQRESVDRLFFLHTDRSIDERLLSDSRISHDSFSPPRWRGFGAGLVSFTPDLLNSVRKHVRFFQSFRPDVVIGLGGYGCLPAGLAASLVGLPLVLMDQNVLPGRAVRSLQPFAELIVTQWQASRNHLQHGNIRVLGNPVRPSLKKYTDTSEVARKFDLDPKRRILLIMGGSQGAKGLNKWVLNHLDLLEKHRDEVALLHIAGPKHRDHVASVYDRADLQHRVIGFTDRMARVYAASDLVLCRAGGTSLAELIHLRKPSVLVPYPKSMENHQLLNARATASTGGSILVRQRDFSRGTFQEHVLHLLLDEKRCREMSSQLDSLRKPKASQNIASALLSLADEPT